MALPQDIQQALFDQTELDIPFFQDLLGELAHKNSFADLYVKAAWRESWSLEDSRIQSVIDGRDRGLGLRVVQGDQIGFSCTQDFDKKSCLRQAKAARSMMHAHQPTRIQLAHPINIQHSLYPQERCDHLLDLATKQHFLLSLDAYTRSLHPGIEQVSIDLSCSYSIMAVFNDDGSYGWDKRPLCRLDIQVVLKDGDKRETGFAGGGGRFYIKEWMEQKQPYSFANEAVRLAQLRLGAQAAPGGSMPVILGPGWPAVLLHEAIGHGLEADFIRKKTSLYTGQLGEKVASEHCTIIDQGNIPNARGSLHIDDEGTPTQSTVLIEKGILKNFLFDKQSALMMGTKSTGNGRRESYDTCPMPRMTNTFLTAGSHNLEDMIASVDDGIYAVNFSGGSVDITSGQFVFSTSEAYRIKNGKILYPVKGATLIGVGPEVMRQVSMVGSDFALDDGVGTCGKNGQSVAVGVGQPSLKIDEIVVGGTDHAE